MTELVKTSGLQLQLMVRQLKKHFVLVKTKSNCWSTSIRMLYLACVHQQDYVRQVGEACDTPFLLEFVGYALDDGSANRT